ncbi:MULTISPECIES: hypothetical protein [unclassified Salinivibrio]|uniref:hypothetical protein n=1 Tax=unclassified Salinivibrio TaxID=2636825 RepID=UPI00128D8B61|nr:MULTISPECIES: hypothetical protein [unclassified Salinivibrio]MPS33141.1 hypothetical protein [Salinivibrio sp. VYel7]MPX94526.1 hypothetical protein [Salinivibrio sp. VYel9]MPX95156.1 hypothetical protein [Salinivibrio sp. VYel6]MPY00723.1 hypothetical protein [Salinivibrio sp. VYel4]MPY03825.1 hypothetical protein [Salinivibrio sp. VYel5]
MPLYETFSYNDNLPLKIYRQLPEKLKIVGNRDPEILLILRLLSGNVELIHNYTDKKIKTRMNYFSSCFTKFSNWKKEFPLYFSEDTTADDLASFIDNTRYINRKFYSVVLAELSQFVLHTNKKSHTSAFIYVYRVLEKISYAFPLIYTSKTQDFQKSFTKLKDLMVGDNEKKELGFFKTFIEMLYKDDSISDTSIDIMFSSSDSEVKRQMFAEVKKVTPPNAIHGDTDEPDMLSIKYCEMGRFIISVRNRFFHNLNGGATNIESEKVVDSDELFSFINPVAMYWIAMVFLQIISFSLSEYQNHRRAATLSQDN